MMPMMDGGGGGAPAPIKAFDKAGLVITMHLSKPDPSDPQSSDISCQFLNSQPADMTDLLFQIAVPKYITMEMRPASGTVVPANRTSTVTQASGSLSRARARANTRALSVSTLPLPNSCRSCASRIRCSGRRAS